MQPSVFEPSRACIKVDAGGALSLRLAHEGYQLMPKSKLVQAF